MELCGCGSLLSILRLLNRGLDENQLSYIIYHVLRGIQYLHVTHRIHRDIKAGNLLITGNGQVKISVILFFL
jgi:serine/threonine protein kinase